MVNSGRRNSQQAPLFWLLGLRTPLTLAPLAGTFGHIRRLHLGGPPRGISSTSISMVSLILTQASSSSIWQDGQECTHPFSDTVPRVVRSRGDVSVLSDKADGGFPSCSCGPQGARERRSQRVVLLSLACRAQTSAQEEGRDTLQRMPPS